MQGSKCEDFNLLSGGTKEQVALALRLAIAELLAVDYDGCLPVTFDDAFTNADATRALALKRMLDLAAEQWGLQIVVLTCSQTDYAGFGAKEVQFV